ncbi:MAG: GDP-mannose 4,6-dehydratase [Rhodospirillaceae bacterium]|nr:GDP-mannose 4,6-dehydratase [Rhodospirillaceae bacterium]
MQTHLVNPEYWKGRTVLVTGATGFLGGWLVRRLLAYGSDVITVVRGERPESQFQLEKFGERCSVVRGQIYDPQLIADLFDRHPISAVLHTAANADVNNALTNPVDNFRSAIDSTMLILEQVRTRRPDCSVVVSSSDKAYGPQPTPFREEAALRPHHPYEVAKASQDLMAQSYGKVFGLPVAVTRCGNYFGGWDFNWTRIIPGTIQAIVENKPVVLRSDGKFTRDFLYIEDAIDIQLMLAERLSSDAEIRGEAFNFSLEVDVEIIDLVKKISAFMGCSTEICVNANAQAEIRLMRVASDKARMQLGWAPAYDLDKALQATIRWYRNYLTAPGAL